MKHRFLFIVMALLYMMTIDNLWAQTPYAVYCEGDQSLHFLSSEEILTEGETLMSNNHTITLLWSGEDVTINGGWKYDPQSTTNIVPENVMKVVFEKSFKDVRPLNCSDWFYHFWKLFEIDNIENLNTSEVTDMSGMFCGCMYLQSLDVSRFDTDNVRDMREMFSGCSWVSTLDVSNFNTGNVEDMAGMFTLCSNLSSLDLSNFNTSKVTDMSTMFYYCSELNSVELSSFNTENVKDMEEMFAGCHKLQSLDVSSFNTRNVTDMFGMFSGCYLLQSLDVSGFNTENVTQMSSMFECCYNLTSLDLSSFNTKNVTGMDVMFAGCRELQYIDLSSFNTDKVEIMESMFQDCTNLTSINLKNFYIDKDTHLICMFYGCSSLQYITLGECVKKMPDFWKCYNIKKIISNINEPLAFNPYRFEDVVKANAKLYVPAGSKSVYAETDGWKEFVNVVANELVPANKENMELTIDGIDDTTDLDGTIVSNIFYNIPKDAGEYNSAEGCIKLTTSTSDEQMNNIVGQNLFDEYLFRNFTGMIFLLDAGNGTLEIDAATIGGMQLNVKVGDAEPVVNTSDAKTTLSVPYTIAEPTYVYIYGSMPLASEAKHKENTDDAAVKIYSIKLADASGIENVMQENKSNSEDVYNLNGQRVSGSYRGIVIRNGKKVIVH